MTEAADGTPSPMPSRQPLGSATSSIGHPGCRRRLAEAPRAAIDERRFAHRACANRQDAPAIARSRPAKCRAKATSSNMPKPTAVAIFTAMRRSRLLQGRGLERACFATIAAVVSATPSPFAKVHADLGRAKAFISRLVDVAACQDRCTLAECGKVQPCGPISVHGSTPGASRIDQALAPADRARLRAYAESRLQREPRAKSVASRGLRRSRELFEAMFTSARGANDTRGHAARLTPDFASLIRATLAAAEQVATCLVPDAT